VAVGPTTDAERFFAVYELTPLPTEPGGPGILRVRADRTGTIKERMKLASELEAIAPLRAKLLEVRDRRKQPLRDEKIVVALLHSCVRAQKTFDLVRYLLARILLQEMRGIGEEHGLMPREGLFEAFTRRVPECKVLHPPNN